MKDHGLPENWFNGPANLSKASEPLKPVEAISSDSGPKRSKPMHLPAELLKALGLNPDNISRATITVSHEGVTAECKHFFRHADGQMLNEIRKYAIATEVTEENLSGICLWKKHIDAACKQIAQEKSEEVINAEISFFENVILYGSKLTGQNLYDRDTRQLLINRMDGLERELIDQLLEPAGGWVFGFDEVKVVCTVEVSNNDLRVNLPDNHPQLNAHITATIARHHRDRGAK